MPSSATSKLKANIMLLVTAIPLYVVAAVISGVVLLSLIDVMVTGGAGYLARLVTMSTASYMAGYYSLKLTMRRQSTANGKVVFYTFAGVFLVLDLISLFSSFPLSQLILSICIQVAGLVGFDRAANKESFSLQ